MIVKKADYDADLRDLRSLQRAPGQFDRQRTASAIRGVEGERSAAHYIDREFGSDDDFVILHDVRLGNAGDFAQTDHIVIDRLTSTIWVLETKSISGTFSWNRHGDWTAEYDSRSLAVESPAAQAQRHCASILLWLTRRGMSVGQVRPVVLIDPRTRLTRTSPDLDVPVLKADVFPSWLKSKRSRQGHGSPSPSVEEVRRIGQAIAAAHVPSRTDWRATLGVARQATSAVRPVTSNAPRRFRTMSRRRQSVIEEVMYAAVRSQTGAFVCGGLGLFMASPLPHAILGAFVPARLTDNPYTAMYGNGLLMAAYMMLPWARVTGFVLVAVAVLALAFKGREPAYRTHLRGSRENAVAAVAIGALALALFASDPPHLFPGKREIADVTAVSQGRRPAPAAAASVAVARTFPATVTVQWGGEQPIGGNLERLDIWDVTGSPQNKVVNIRNGVNAMITGMHTPAYATVYVRAGQKVSLMLPAGQPYRITAMAGDRWQGPEELFGQQATTVDFGVTTLSAGQPQVIAMGASDQTANVVPNDRF